MSEIYAGSPAGLNDPFDCQFDPKLALRHAIEIAGTHERVPIYNWILEEFEKLDPRQKGLGVSCFTCKMDSPVMWSHYAEGHQGVCLLYDIPDKYVACTYSSEKNSPYFVGQSPVEYGDSPFLDWLLEGDMNNPRPGEPVMNAATRTLNTKYTQWNYEEEFRIIMSEPCFIRLEPHFLKQVTFGLRTPKPQKSLIRRVVSKNSADTLFVQASQNPQDGFKLSFEDLD